jgi:hypothetical protein
MDKCGKCGSEKIIPLVRVEAFAFKGRVNAKLKANICGECGCTELIVKNPAALYDAYLKDVKDGYG